MPTAKQESQACPARCAPRVAPPVAPRPFVSGRPTKPRRTQSRAAEPWMPHSCALSSRPSPGRVVDPLGHTPCAHALLSVPSGPATCHPLAGRYGRGAHIDALVRDALLLHDSTVAEPVAPPAGGMCAVRHWSAPGAADSNRCMRSAVARHAFPICGVAKTAYRCGKSPGCRWDRSPALPADARRCVDSCSQYSRTACGEASAGLQFGCAAISAQGCATDGSSYCVFVPAAHMA